MDDEKLESTIEDVVKANHYSEEQEEQFRKFMDDLLKEYSNPRGKSLDQKTNNNVTESATTAKRI